MCGSSRRTRDWLRYEVPEQWIRRELRGNYRGQKQIWYLLRLVGRDSDVCLRAQRQARIRRLALARLLDSARLGHRVQARRVRTALQELARFVFPPRAGGAGA